MCWKVDTGASFRLWACWPPGPALLPVPARHTSTTLSLRMQGGEFAFVLLALANQLNVLPADLNRLLIIVVVLSMVSCLAWWWCALGRAGSGDSAMRGGCACN